MSVYDTDDRVVANPDGTWMVFPGGPVGYNVAPLHIGRDTVPGIVGVFDVYGAYLGNSGPFDDVVRSLIGDPR